MRGAARAWRRARESDGRRAAESPGEYRHEQALDLLLGLVRELGADGCEDQPVQHSGCAASAEDQLLALDIREVRVKHAHEIGPNPIEAGGEPIPFLRRIDSDPRHDAHDGELTTSQ